MTTAAASQAVLILTAGVLFYVALIDLKHYKIRNEFILVLTALFFVHAFLSGRWVTIQWNFGFALLLFVIMLYFYLKKMMGGGDLKLLTVALLWVGPFCALPFALFVLLFVCVHLVAVKLKLVETQVLNGKKWIAFAPAVAAALISVFMAGCLQPV
jgi:prepilin peptidase CpaA